MCMYDKYRYESAVFIVKSLAGLLLKCVTTAPEKSR